ncbi:ParA family protein [Salinibacter altiplanensis]|uniref:ParA family protein n=1 Tax=Salinibacter altiplanensis TaxID=1803181 RepID=UPI000C9F76E1|nr:ParA family protein [Salinibacter altiplanensis]
MTVLSVCNHKGGTGKTTTTIHVAAALGLSGWRTLVIDLDPQGFLTHTMGIEEPPSEQSVAAFFAADADPARIPIQETAGFDLIPSSSTLTRRMRDLNKPTDVLWVREALRRLDLEYDLLLFDTAAAVTVYSLNALVASQHVLIPVLPEYQSVVGGEQTYQTTELVENKLNPRLDTRQFLFTQVDARKRIHKTYREYIRKKYGEAVMDAIIRTSTSLAKTRDGATTVFDHEPRSRGALDYANATDELTARLQAASEEAASETDRAAAAPDDLSTETAPEVSKMLNS